MDSEDELTDVRSLLNELDTIYRKWDSNTLESYLMDQDREIGFSSETIELSFDKREMIKVLQGLLLLTQSLEAEQFVKDSLHAKMSSEQRWSKVAEIMLVKTPGEKLKPHGVDEIMRYKVLVEGGYAPKLAAREVYRQFKFSSQEACNKWLCDEITRYKKSGNMVFSDLKKPSKSDV